MREGVAICVLFLFLANGLMVSGNGGADGAGSGANGRDTSRATTLIYDVFDLQNMSLDLGGTYELANDIDASATANWNGDAGFLPVGNKTSPFNGSLDGHNHTITGLFINRPGADYVGLFGYMDAGASVANVGLVKCNITGNGVVGGLAGCNDQGSVANSHAAGDMTGNGSVGGLLGSNNRGSVTGSYASGNAKGKSWSSVGGLVGYNSGAVDNSYATGNAVGNADGTETHVGGLIGCSNGSVNNSYATGNANGNSWVGGLVGRNSGPVSNSYATGDVIAKRTAGGLLGIAYDCTVSNSYATGDVTGKYGVGGLVGTLDNATVKNSHYGFEKMLINGGHHITVGGLYDAQYRDWLAGNLRLDISDYSTSLVQSGGYYGISSVQGIRDLLCFADIAGYRFRLTADIDLSSAPGLCIPYLAAELDGGNHTISNLKVDMSFVVAVGMFGYDAGGTIRNIGLINGYVNGYESVGGLVGLSTGTVDRSYATGTVNGSLYVGGLAGYTDRGIVNNSFATGNVYGMGSVGGLVGDSGEVKNSHATGNVEGSSMGVGGLVGYGDWVYDSYATGNVYGSDYYVGGLAGCCYEVNNSHATGNVSGTSPEIGGLVGHGGNVNNSYATGNVNGTGIEVGGLMGICSMLNNSYATGSVSGNLYVGGLAGRGSNMINSYATGNVTGSSYVGGLVGSLDTGPGMVRNSHYDIDKMLINGGHHITMGGLFDAQYRDWFSGNLSLDISDYNTSLVPSGSYYDINGVQGLRDLLGFADVAIYEFRLAADIDLSTDPGLYIPYIEAEFDGENHTISNIDLDISFAMAIGLFGYNNGGTVSNIGLVGIDVNGLAFVGGFVGANFGIVDNAFASGNVTGTEEYVGGLVGYDRDGTVNNSCSTVNVAGSGDYVGGLVGEIVSGVVNNSNAAGNVIGSGDNVGGLVGAVTTPVGYNWGYVWGDTGSVNNSHAAGNVSGRRNVGGLAGFNSFGKVDRSYATGNVNGTGDYVGGLVGYVTAIMNGQGRAEEPYHNGTVTDAYATGNVSSAGNYTGGLVGYNNGWVYNSYAAGRVDGYAYVGGLAGNNIQGAAYGCFWDKETSGQNESGGGTGKTTAQMKTKSTFTGAGWDFDTIWCMIENVTYPTFQRQDAVHLAAHAGVDQTVDQHALVAFDGSKSRGSLQIVNYTWTFQDDGPRTLYGARPTYRFDRPGTFVVTLEVADSAGNRAADAVEVTVIELRFLRAEAGPDIRLDQGAELAFDGSKSESSAGIVRYLWTFHDGADISLDGIRPAYRFRNAGGFVVTLNVTDSHAGWATDALTVTVNDTTPPAAQAGSDRTVDEGATVMFDGSGSSDNAEVVNFTWIFTDGGPVTLYGVRPVYRFDRPGIFTVTLTVTDAAGNRGADNMTVTVRDITGPVADAGPDRLVDEGSWLTFDGTGSSDNVGVVNYTWTFTDGGPVTLYGARPTYEFDNPGVFVVALEVMDAAGSRGNVTMTVTVKDMTAPIANAGPDRTVDQGTVVTFNGNGSSDNVGIVNYTWTFYFGTQKIVLYGVSPSFTFSVPGVYHVQLNVSDAAGFQGQDIITLTVKDITPPVANAGRDQMVVEGSTVVFDGSRSTDNCGVEKYFWNLTYDGKAQNLEGKEVSFRFAKPGVYVAVLTVVDGAGNRGEDRVVITVEPKVNVLQGLLWMPVLLIAVAGIAGYMILRKRTARKGGPMQEDGSLPG